MLGHEFRFRASNAQNQAITVTLRGRLWKFGATGAIEYSTEQTFISAASVAATSGTTASTDFDNSSSLWIGAELLLTCTAATTTNGANALSITLERSTDGGTTWPTAGQGQPLGGYTVTAADATNARSKNLTVD